MVFQKGHQINKGRKYPNRISPFKDKHHTEISKKQNSEAHRGQIAWNKGIPMSEEAKLKNSISHIGQCGELAGNWKGGISRAYKTGYYSIEYKAWREAVFIRDIFTCQGCGKMGYITAHHIKSFTHYPESRFDLENGITLCEDCHSQTDNYKGKNKR